MKIFLTDDASNTMMIQQIIKQTLYDNLIKKNLAQVIDRKN